MCGGLGKVARRGRNIVLVLFSFLLDIADLLRKLLENVLVVGILDLQLWRTLVSLLLAATWAGSR